MIRIQWCGICNSKPAEGVLGVDTGEDEPVLFDVCTNCAKSIADQSQINLEDITK